MSFLFRSCTVVLISFSTGCAEKGPHVQDVTVAALTSDDAGLVEFLHSQIERARALPHSATRRGDLAMAYDANGFVDAAIIEYSQAMRLAPENATWPYLSAQLHAERGDLLLALDNLGLSVDLEPTYAPAYLHRGFWLLDLARVDEAIDSFRTAQTLFPTEHQDVFELVVSSGLAQSYQRAGDAQRALEVLQENPRALEHPYTRRQLGVALRQLGKRDAAAQLLGDTQDIAPIRWPDHKVQRKQTFVRGFSGLLLLAEDLIETGDFRTAVMLLGELYQSYDLDPAVVNNLSIAYTQLGDNAKALELLQEALTEFPDDYLLNFTVATHLEQRGEMEAALTHYSKAIEQNPSIIPAYDRKAELLIQLDRLVEAGDVLKAAFEHAEPNAQSYYYGGVVDGVLGNWASAIELFRDAIEIDPTYGKAYASLSISLAEAGQVDEAGHVLEAGREFLGDSPLFREAKVIVEERTAQQRH